MWSICALVASTDFALILTGRATKKDWDDSDGFWRNLPYHVCCNNCVHAWQNLQHIQTIPIPLFRLEHCVKLQPSQQNSSYLKLLFVAAQTIFKLGMVITDDNKGFFIVYIVFYKEGTPGNPTWISITKGVPYSTQY